ncbi:PDZ domain-containing protein [Patescibacteria group bacterium]|nr:MAG: PDZ domain-containing protein [Patescibacteria group bacterium]
MPDEIAQTEKRRGNSVPAILGKIIFVFVFGSGGALFANYYLMPKLSTYPALENLGIFKKFKENVTVITRTEQVTVKEDTSVAKVASQASASSVTIISVPSGSVKTDAARLSPGVIVTNDGLIVTYRNALLESGATYSVITNTGATYSAALRAVDDFSNLAFLKIEASNLTAVSFANSDDFSAGRKLIAVGIVPGDFQNRYAAGILSATSKAFNISSEAVASSGKLESIFEVDFGNNADFVGGPAIDYNGDVVGIIGSVRLDNRDKYFAIPANVVRRTIELTIADQLKNRASLGVSYVSITKPYALAHALSRDKGALVFSPSGKQGLAVMANSSAEKAGIKVNDIILTVDGQEINLDNPLSNVVHQHAVGESVDLSILRDGKEQTVRVSF